MNTHPLIHSSSFRFYHFSILAVLLSLGIIPTAAQADPPAHGIKQMLLACDRTIDGWQVSSAQVALTVNPATENDYFPLKAITPEPGEQCLPILAKFPVAMIPRKPSTFLLPKTAQGATVDIPACIIWVIDGAEVASGDPVIISCDADGLGNVLTQDVFGADYPLPTGEQCLTTLQTFEQMGYRRRQGPITATLGQDVEDNYVGGLLWTRKGANSMAVIECNKDPVSHELVVTSYETEQGLMATGGSCLTAIAEGGSNGALSLNGPTALPAAGTGTSDPGCLVWDVDGGTVPE